MSHGTGSKRGDKNLGDPPPNGQAGPACVKQLARRKKLPADFLRENGFFDLSGGGVGVRYRDEDGEELFCRKRDVPGDPRRFAQPAGVRLCPFGLWRRDTNSRGSATMKGDPSGEASRDETFVCDPPPAA